jgi:hypothetical protein
MKRTRPPFMAGAVLDAIRDETAEQMAFAGVRSSRLPRQGHPLVVGYDLR